MVVIGINVFEQIDTLDGRTSKAQEFRDHHNISYPILVDLQLSAEIPDQLESLVLLATRYEGGPIAIPFLVPADTQLVLTVLGRPVDRRQAKRIAID